MAYSVHLSLNIFTSRRQRRRHDKSFHNKSMTMTRRRQHESFPIVKSETFRGVDVVFTSRGFIVGKLHLKAVSLCNAYTHLNSTENYGRNYLLTYL